jgi:hypothetical protein
LRAHGPERCSGGTAETDDDPACFSCKYYYLLTYLLQLYVLSAR